ncbi:MAG: FHA domain-containing protein [Labilithrix sp.]|nr:FHA domain-containing protein [Labilithrix sp.]
MALTLKAWLDRTSVKPDVDARAHVVLEVEAAEGASVGVEGERPPATTVLAIDVSGSMQGEPLDQVVRSVDLLLDALRPDDRVGVVAFADGASRVAEPVAVDAAGKRLVRSRVARLFAEGHTNVEAGLALSAEMLGAPAGRRHGVVLLSDGEPNVGAATAEALREVVRKHRGAASFSALGYGVKHDEDILSAIGDAGGGGYAFVQDPATCARAFARALGAQADVVARDVELTLAPADGVEVVRMLGGEPTRFGSEGLVVALQDMVPATRRLVVVEVAIRAPGAAKLLATILRVGLRWRPVAGPPARASADVSVEIADRDPAPVAEAVTRVLLVRADRVRDEARALADRRQFGGAAAALRALLAEIDRSPGFVAGDGSALAEAYELLVDEAVAMERRPDAEAYAMFRKSTLGSKLAMQAPPSSRGAASMKLIEHTAGDYPVAFIVVKSGPDAGKRHRLREECVIGRTASADIPLAHASISRRHAEIYALEGEYWACDLGSTNVTKVNGEPLGAEPRKLEPGDVVVVGDVELVYEQKA